MKASIVWAERSDMLLTSSQFVSTFTSSSADAGFSGGKSKTIMIANMGPSVYNIVQTREKLNYAIACGTITSHESALEKVFEEKRQQKLKEKEEMIMKSQHIKSEKNS